jgi:hypothetical protein
MGTTDFICESSSITSEMGNVHETINIWMDVFMANLKVLSYNFPYLSLRTMFELGTGVARLFGTQVE